jgi:hypothetical protein
VAPLTFDTSNALTPFGPIVINIGLPSSAPVVTEQNAVPETKFVSQTKSPFKMRFSDGYKTRGAT